MLSQDFTHKTGFNENGFYNKMSINGLLQKINFEQTYVKLTDLNINEPYQIIAGDFKKTKLYPQAILLTLAGNNNVFLPHRFTSLISKKDLDDMIKANVCLVYKGKKKIGSVEINDVAFVKSA